MIATEDTGGTEIIFLLVILSVLSG